MKRLFLFSIGGTGSRVVRSLTHLLASGVPLKDSDGQLVELVPILIDTDNTNQDTLSCIKLLETYQRIHAERSQGNVEGVGFFSTPVTPLAGLQTNDSKISGLSSSFRSDFTSVTHKSFSQFIAYEQIDDQPTRYLLDALYSRENLREELTGGFLGNPNIGATVLAAFKESEDFRYFAQIFRPQTDRVFAINSIFGGTGAAGLPWLVKLLRSADQRYGAAEAIRNSIIGALTVLPYFQVQSDDSSRIDSASFVTKTKAALSYYHRHIGELNALYYIADTQQAAYPNHESGPEQSNPAHLVELLGALAITDFVAAADHWLSERGGAYFEFALERDADRVTFATLGTAIDNQLRLPMTQMRLFSMLAGEHFRNVAQQPWAAENKLSKAFFSSSAYTEGIGAYLSTLYPPWIAQLAGNRRSFGPFDLSVSTKNLAGLVTDRPLKTSFLRRAPSSNTFDDAANRLKGPRFGMEAHTSRFLDIGWHGTEPIATQLRQE